MRPAARVLALLVAGALLLAGCGSGGAEDSVEENPPGEKIFAEADFPLPAADLRASPTEGISDADLRRLAAALADLDGVAATEADYRAHRIAVVFEAGLDGTVRGAVARRVAAVPGIASLEPRL